MIWLSQGVNLEFCFLRPRLLFIDAEEKNYPTNHEYSSGIKKYS